MVALTAGLFDPIRFLSHFVEVSRKTAFNVWTAAGV